MALINVHLNSCQLYLARFLVVFRVFKCLLQKSSFRDGIGKVSKGHGECLCPRLSTFY